MLSSFWTILRMGAHLAISIMLSPTMLMAKLAHVCRVSSAFGNGEHIQKHLQRDEVFCKGKEKGGW